MPDKKAHIVYTEPIGKKGKYKIYSVKTKDFLGTIEGDNAKKYWEAFDETGKFLISSQRKKQCMDFFRERDTKKLMAQGGGIGFEKLSKQVAKEYEGDKVAPKYQDEYGKTYSKLEAREVGDKVAGKVYWQQQGRKFGNGGGIEDTHMRISKAIFLAYGNIDDAVEFKEYDPTSGVSPYRLVLSAVQKGWITPEEINKDVLNSAYETSSETEEADEIGSSDMNHYVWSMLRDAGFDMKVANGKYIRVDKMATGGSTENAHLSVEEYRKYYPIIGRGQLGYEFNFDPKHTAFIVPKSGESLNLVKNEVENATDGELTVVPFQHDIISQTSGTKAGFYQTGEQRELFKVIKNKKHKMATGGTTSKMDEYVRQQIEKQRKEEDGKTFPRFRAFVYEDSYQFADFKTDDFHKAVKWAKETLEKQRDYRENSKRLWAIVDEFVPIEKRNNVIYPYSEVARFGEDKIPSMKFGQGGSMSNGVKTYYIVLADGSKKEFTVNHPKEITGIYFAMGLDRGADSIEKGLPMVHYNNELAPLYHADGTPVAPMPELAGKDYFDLKNKMAEGGNTTFYYDQAKKTLGEELYNFIASLNQDQLEIQLKRLQAEIERMKAYDTEFTKQEFLPKLKQEEKFILYRLGRLNEFKYEDGGNVDKTYERTFRNNAGKDILVKIMKNPIFGKYDYWVDGSVRGTFDTYEEAYGEIQHENFDMYAKGGLIVTSIKDIPNFKEELEAGRITYRGLGMGKLSKDFYNIAGEGGTQIKVKGKEYFITDTEFNTFSRDKDGYMKVRFDAPRRRFDKGGNFDSEFYKEGGKIKVDLANDTYYVNNENIKLVKYKNGKEVYNWEYWYGSDEDNRAEVYSGLVVSKSPITDPNQYSMFKDGGKMPEDAMYIKRSDIDSVIIYDEKTGNEVEIPSNKIVSGIWFDNSRAQILIDRAKKEGLLSENKKKNKK